MSMIPFFKEKLGESFKWYSYTSDTGPKYRYHCMVTQVDERTNKVQFSVTMKYITPSGLPSGSPEQLGSHWCYVSNSLEETLKKIIHEIPGHPLGQP